MTNPFGLASYFSHPQKHVNEAARVGPNITLAGPCAALRSTPRKCQPSAPAGPRGSSVAGPARGKAALAGGYAEAVGAQAGMP